MCSVGGVGKRVVVIGILALDIPHARHIGILHTDRRLAVIACPCQIIRSLQCFFHKLVDIFWLDPSRTDTHLDLACVKVWRHNTLQSFHIDGIGSIAFRNLLRHRQLFTHISRKVFVCCLPFFTHRLFEDDTCKVVRNLLLRLARKLCHVW